MKTCPWRIHVSRHSVRNMFVIKKNVVGNHNCEHSTLKSNWTSTWISRILGFNQARSMYMQGGYKDTDKSRSWY